MKSRQRPSSMSGSEMASRIVSHRGRGFDRFDNTIDGLRAALSSGVSKFEFDVRKTRDGILVAAHDPFFVADTGKLEYFDAWDFADLAAQRSLSHLATVEEMARVFALVSRSEAVLYLDLKVAGVEARITKILEASGLLERCVVVSWLPDVIENCHRLMPTLPLCFCHLSLARLPELFAIARFICHPRLYDIVSSFVAPFASHRAREISNLRLHFHKCADPGVRAPDGERARYFEGHVVRQMVDGRMKNILRACNGMVCLPLYCATPALIRRYQEDGIKVVLYSIGMHEVLKDIFGQYKPDLVCIADADLIRTVI